MFRGEGDDCAPASFLDVRVSNADDTWLINDGNVATMDVFIVSMVVV